jgi:hypothetical protein
MGHKTSVTLPGDLHATWKAAGLPLAEVIRRGLDGTGDTARHAATEARLAQVEARLAQLEARAARPSVFTADTDDLADYELAEPADPPTLEEIEQRRELHDRAKAGAWHRQLVRHVEPDKAGQRIVTANTAGAAFRLGTNAARDRMHMLASFGLATFIDDGETPYRWLIHDQEAEGSADTVAGMNEFESHRLPGESTKAMMERLGQPKTGGR